MKAHLVSALMLALLAVAGVHAQPQTSGIDVANIDSSVRPQDNFFLHLNGKWLAQTAIPADKSSWGSFEKLDDELRPQLRVSSRRRPPIHSGSPAPTPSASVISSPATWTRPGWKRCGWRR